MASRRHLPMKFLLLLLPFLLLAFLSPLTAVYAQSANDEDHVMETGAPASTEQTGLMSEGGEDVLDLRPASGVETAAYFPKPADRLIAGEPAEVVLGISHNGDEDVKVSVIQASLLPPYDHRFFIQNFTAQELGDTVIPRGVQASFPYSFTLNKYLQPGSFALVGNVYYYVGKELHKSVFYNGTVTILESGSMITGETVFLVTLGLGLLGLLSMWVSGQVQRLSKKSRRPKKVESGTRSASTDAANNEWLQGTAFTAKAPRSIAQQTKSKKKK